MSANGNRRNSRYGQKENQRGGGSGTDGGADALEGWTERRQFCLTIAARHAVRAGKDWVNVVAMQCKHACPVEIGRTKHTFGFSFITLLLPSTACNAARLCAVTEDPLSSLGVTLDAARLGGAFLHP